MNKSFLLKIIEKSNVYKSSDIHISDNNYIGYRVQGKIIKEKKYEILSEGNTKTLFNEMLEYLSDKNCKYIKESLDKEGIIGFGLEIKELKIKFRVNVSTKGDGYYIVMRRNEINPPALDTLGFYEETLIGLKTITKKKAGIFLVVGATGSGKSTTLAAMIREINEFYEKNIITLEDPIEYEHIPRKSLVVQKELGRDLKSFDIGLKSALREDPDIILVGEIRDYKSLDLAMKAAETGHLVFSTLHTDNTLSTIQRIVAMSDNAELTRDRLSQTLLGVIAQRLEPTKNGNRIVVWEQLLLNMAIKNNIKEDNLNQVKAQIDQCSMSQSFNKTLIQHFNNGKLTKEEILRISSDKENILALLN
jgi:twitching motility protein PilT